MRKYRVLGLIAVLAAGLALSLTVSVIGASSPENMSTYSTANVTSSQALDFGELHGKMMKDILNILIESKSNLTAANQIVLDKLVQKGLMTDNEKQTLLPYVVDLRKKVSETNLDNVKQSVSKLLQDFYKNNSSVSVIGLTSILNNSISNLNSTDILESTNLEFPSGLEPAYALRPQGSTVEADLMCGGATLYAGGVGLFYVSAAACSALAASGALGP